MATVKKVNKERQLTVYGYIRQSKHDQQIPIDIIYVLILFYGNELRISLLKKSTYLHTHYDILNVDKTASSNSIRKAYRALSKLCHPDRIPKHLETHKDSFQEFQKKINEAYEVLSNQKKRCLYDMNEMIKYKQCTMCHQFNYKDVPLCICGNKLNDMNDMKDDMDIDDMDDMNDML